MTDKRRKYEDNYSPVFDIAGEQPQAEPAEELPSHTDLKPAERKERATAHRVKRKPRQAAKKLMRRLRHQWAESRLKAAGAASKPRSHRRLRDGFLEYCSARSPLISWWLSYHTSQIASKTRRRLPTVPSARFPRGQFRRGRGARLAEFFINESFGLGSFVIILWMIAVSLKLLSGWPKFKTINFTIKCIVALITVSLIIGLLTLSFNSPVNWGGYHGRYVNEFIVGFAGWTGAVILCIALIAIFIVICLRDLVNWIIRKKNVIAEKRRKAAAEKAERLERERRLEELKIREAEDAIRAGEAAAAEEQLKDEGVLKFAAAEVDIDPSLSSYEIEDDSEDDGPESPRVNDPSDALAGADGYSISENPSDAGSDENIHSESGMAVASAAGPSAHEAEVREPDPSGDEASDEDKDSIEDPAEDIDENPAENSGKNDGENVGEEEGADRADQMVVNVNQIAMADKKAVERNSSDPLIRTQWKFPSPLLLREGSNKVSVDVMEQQANKEKIRETLLYHGIPITDISATVGPTITLYEIRPDQGIKIAKIKNLADDIALSLAATGVRIIAPIPGKGTVGIEVANNDMQTVSMRTVILSRKFNETRYKLPVALGSTIGNDVYIADLAKMPHLLVAGATGQGKSVGLNAIIASLLYKKRPDELKFVMIDPKEVEFSLYAKIEQHYLAKLEDNDAIVTDMSKVVGVLTSLCVEMDNRYKLLKAAGVRNIEEYNPKVLQNQLDPREGHRFLPYIVLVVDEFADLIMTSGKEVEMPIARLAQKARAIGIHVIIATQRPSTNVITGLIKANFPVRIAFKVSSGIDSKTILDTTGAQALIGRGDMLISNNSEMVRVQCAFIDTPEVEQICEYISRQPFNSGAYLLPEPPLGVDGEDGGGGGGFTAGELDPLFDEVAELVVTSGQGSTSGIQRRYSIGYNRAGKIMDQLEHYGVVGPSIGAKPRQVLMDMYGLEELLRTLHG